MIRNYFRGAGIVAFAESLIQLKGLIILPFLTRQFGPVDYGAWSQVSVLISTLAPVILLGTDAAIMRYLPGMEPEKQKRYFSGWLLFLTGLAILFAAPLLMFPESISILVFGETGEYALLMPLAAAWLINTHMVNAMLNWFRVKNDAKSYSALKVVRALLNVSAVAFMLILDQGVYQLLLYTLLSDALLLLVSGVMVSGRWGWARPDFSLLGAMLRFGLPLVPAGFAIWGLNYVDRFFIVRYASLEEVGVYAVAYRIAYQSIPILAAPLFAMYNNSAAELYNQKETSTLQRLFERVAGSMLALTLPAAIGLPLVGERILAILAPGEYGTGIQVMLFVALGYIALALSGFYTNGFGLVHKQYLTTVAYLMAMLSNIGLNILLVPRFSILGAAIATCASFIFLLGLCLYYSSRENVLSTNFIYVAKIVVASLGMGLGVAWLDRAWVGSLANTVLELSLLAFVGIALYAALLWLEGVLNKSEIKLVLSLFRR